MTCSASPRTARSGPPGNRLDQPRRPGYVVGMEASDGRPATGPGDLAGALHATAPDPGLAAPLALFGRFIGAWDIEWRGTGRDGNPATMHGDLHFGWVLDGRAVQDVWRVPSSGVAPPGLRPFHGTTLRFYDPSLGAWRFDLDRPAERAGPPVHRPPRGRGHHPRRAGRRASRAVGLPRHHARPRPGVLPVDRGDLHGRPPHLAAGRGDADPAPLARRPAPRRRNPPSRRNVLPGELPAPHALQPGRGRFPPPGAAAAQAAAGRCT